MFQGKWGMGNGKDVSGEMGGWVRKKMFQGKWGMGKGKDVSGQRRMGKGKYG
jgi:hypothetical protein